MLTAPVAVSATTFTVKVRVVGVFVPSSKAVTVTVKLPVAPVGALSIKTPFCVSVMMLAELILTGGVQVAEARLALRGLRFDRLRARWSFAVEVIA